MKRTILVACLAVWLLPAAGFAAEGAASKAELSQLYQRYFQQKDEQKLGTLVYWEKVTQQDREGFYRSVRNDLMYRLHNVEFVQLDPDSKLEYTRDGVVYGPGLPPVGRMVANYEGQGNVSHLSTSYLVGMKGGRYFIVLAVPKGSH